MLTFYEIVIVFSLSFISLFLLAFVISELWLIHQERKAGKLYMEIMKDSFRRDMERRVKEK